MLDQAESLRRLANEKKSKIITITSGKGGVGKSNFVVNLGLSLMDLEKKVLILDADIGMGNDDVLMGVYPRYNIMDLIKGKSIEEVIVEGPNGIHLLPGGSGLNQVEDLKEDERLTLTNSLKKLDNYDYILIDTGAGINRSVLAFIACSEEVIVITTPEPTSLTDAYSLVKAVNHFKIKTSIKVVVNRALSRNEGVETYNKFRSAVEKFLSLKVEYYGCVYDDRKVTEGVRKQIPFTRLYPNSEVTKSLKNVADIVAKNNVGMNIGAEGLFRRLFSIFS